MPYIGTSPSQGVRRVHTYTATANQTSFSGAGAEGATLSYKDSNFVDVYQNGVKLGDADYTATSGTAIVLGTGATVSDLVVIVAYDVFSAADTVSKADGGQFDGNVTMAGTLGVTGVLTGTSLDISGNIDIDGTANLDVVDIDGAVDMASTLQVDGAITSSAGATITTADNSNNLTLISTDADASTGPNLVLQRDSASPADNDLSGTIKFIADNDAAEATDCVSIFSKIIDASNGSEDASLLINSIVGGSQISRFNITPLEIAINDDSVDLDFRVESNGNANMLFVDGGNDKVGIGIVPTARLSLPAQASGDSGIARFAIESAVDSNDFTIAQYEDSTGTYTQIGQNVSLNSGGSTTVLDSGHRTASMFFDGRGNGALMFHTGGTNANAERMRIDSSGNHRWQHTSGDPSAFSSSAVGIQFTPSGQTVSATIGNTGYVNRTNYSSGTIYYNIFMINGSSTVGSISYNGSSTSYTTSSDYRLKENVSYDFDATSRLKQLKPSRFNFIGKSETVDGFLAHEVSSIVPEAITGEKDGVEDVGSVKTSDGTVVHTDIPEDKFPLEENQTWTKTGTKPVHQQIDQAKLVPLLVKTIQELEARITALESA
jgi:hypothetical protein